MPPRSCLLTGYMSSHEGWMYFLAEIYTPYSQMASMLKHSYYLFYLNFSDFSVVVWCKPVVNAIGYSFPTYSPP